jgi:hypothetical protein
MPLLFEEGLCAPTKHCHFCAFCAACRREIRTKALMQYTAVVQYFA